jgi:DNA sulfur modification protein DndB
MLLSDIVDYIQERHGMKFSIANKEIYMSHVQDCLKPLTEYIMNLDKDLKTALMKEKGAGGPIKYWRRFQTAINAVYDDFNPVGLKEYIENEERALNNQVYSLIRDIESFMQNDFKEKLFERFGEEWAWKKGVPDKIADAAEEKMRKKNRTRSKAEETDEWDNLDLIHYRMIADKNWSYMVQDDDGKKRNMNFMKIHYMRPGYENEKSGDRCKWLVKLNEIRKIVSHVSSDQVGEEEYNFVKDIHDWLIKKEKRNKLQIEKESEINN